MRTRTPKGTDTPGPELAAEAYVYGYPLLCSLRVIRLMNERGMTVPATPFNTFGHADRLADAGSRFVSVNNDTLYSFAPLDLAGGPLLLNVPDGDGSYRVLQFIDAWTNSFAYLGSRSGAAAGRWLVTPPGWNGAVPDGLRGVIKAPTRVVVVAGRHACAGPDDLPRARALQRRLGLEPLAPAAGPLPGLPQPDPRVPAPLADWEELRIAFAAFPPAAAEHAHLERFRPLGLLDATPERLLAPALADVLTLGLARGRQRVEHAHEAPPAEPGGWSTDPHLADYNLDHFGPGRLDDPHWRTADRAASHLARASVARTALWANHGYEAVYATARTDADGRQLNGAHSYRLRFEQPPPVDAFWSLTMYDAPGYHLVANPADRYSVGDRTPGLIHASDGSLTLCLQHREPTDPVERANWLPAPAGNFRPMLRMYGPRPEVLDGSYRIPPITAHPR
ncbi:DUF1254 domain-containing protein [Kitasatospora phosalacinea]|uniref:DUF1254 domain-containing protein n=1 Tax=Kitasatospora phosalacinea TaxID=2065 RepID=A0ABW6GJW7_9ACTN